MKSRLTSTRNACFLIGDLLVETAPRRVSRNGRDLGVAGLSFDLLLALGRAHPGLLSLDGIMDAVWPGQEVGAEVVAQRIRLLRRQLGDESTCPRYIGSRRSHGYRLLLPMRELPQRPSDSPRAQSLYLQARAMMRGTARSRDQALDFLDQALALDPLFAAALAHRALLVAGSIPLSGISMTRLAEPEQAAQRALELDISAVDAHVALGIVAAARHEWASAQRHFDDAARIIPDDVFVTNLHAAFVLRPTGRLREALDVHRRCHEQAPADGFTLHELVLTHSLLGEDERARHWWQLGETLSGIADPPWDIKLAFSRAALRAGDSDGSARIACDAMPATLRNSDAERTIREFHLAIVDSTRKASACRMLEALAPALGMDGVDARTRSYFITLPALLGDRDTAYELLDGLLFPASGPQRNVELGELWLPEMREFRSDIRFLTLCARLGMDPAQRADLSP